VLDWLMRAGPVVVYRAPRVAEKLLRDALAGLPEADPRRDGLEMSLLTAEMLLYREDEVQDVGRRLLARTRDSDRAGQVAWVVAYSLMRTGQAAEAIELVRQTLARPGIGPGPAARLTALPAPHLVALGQTEEAASMATAALGLAQQAGDAVAAGYARHALSCVRSGENDSAGMIEQIDEGLVAVGDHPQGTHVRLLLLTNKIATLTDLDRRAEALEAAGQALVLAEQGGNPRVHNIRVHLANCYFEAGQWDDAMAEAEQATLTAEHTNVHLERHSLQALIAAYRGDPDAAAGYLGKITDEQAREPHNRTMIDLMWWARAVLAEQRGDDAGAIVELGRGLQPDMAGLVPAQYLLMPMLARLALGRGETEIAKAAAEAAAQEAETESLPRKVATAGYCRGLLAGDPAPVLAAAGYWGTAGQPLQQAAALEDAAALAAAAGDKAGARAALGGARELYAGLGARWAASRAEARLGALGVRGARARYRPRPVTGWAALTPTEIKVGELVATGLSNPDIASRLFLSRNTVQTHVSHILAKLGARSRAEIARTALEHA
jgi:DNA-binding CsgD family transcriptional regulator/tetratricopeptide (TPR) repeat protein